MQPSELVRTIDDVCARLGLEYFITGSVASTYYGVYRNTLGVDVVLALAPVLVGEFCGRFTQPEWYVSDDAARDAARRGGMFNIIHVPWGMKIAM